jgi:lipoate-protein ligase A
MPELWRLILDAPLPGASNMAIDEAILGAVGRGEAPPTLRLYAWDPACLSLGYAQHIRDVDLARLQANGWDLVRRMTGGRAILHIDELTYSVALPNDHRLAAGGISESYRRLSAALLAAVNRIGLDAAADKQAARPSERPGPVCFEVPSDYEITASGKKLIGSAQVRRQTAMLQHGTLPLFGNVTRICDALLFADDSARGRNRMRVANRATTLSDALGRNVGWAEAADAVIESFQRQFEIQFMSATLSSAEQADADALSTARYAAEPWTLKI